VMVSTVLSAHDDTSHATDEEDWRMSMAQLIEFDTLARFTPTVKWRPDEQRGKVIPFMSQRRGMSDELVCAAYEELDSECCRWPESDEALYHAAFE
jgi:hypothetical protein